MNKSLKKSLISIFILCATVALIAVVMALSPKHVVSYADVAATVDAEQEFVVVDRSQEVDAEFSFVRLNDRECSVRLTNKADATVAVIPKETVIEGVTYKVTEIAANGFMSSPKLKEVKMLSNIKKIGSTAFGNCAMLQKVSMGNVEIIEKNAFYRCSKLEKIVLPRSLTTLGANVFRNNNTHVMARAAEAGAGWSSTWNTGNGNQNVEYGSKYKEPLELQAVYATNEYARTENATVFVGYELTEGQPRAEQFYEQEGEDIFIPCKYNDEDIIGIVENAFDGSKFDRLVIEYSETPIYIGSEAFTFSECKSIIVNRSIIFEDSGYGFERSDSIFSGSKVVSVVLPDDLTEIADSMFVGCENLLNVYFNKPVSLDREGELKIIDNLSKETKTGVISLPQNESFSYIGESSFDGTTSVKELHIYDNVKTVGASVTAGWTEEQCVFVHNDNVRIKFLIDISNGGWHIDCFGGTEQIIYSATYYTVTLDFNDGATLAETIDVKLNEAIGALPRSERDNYDFIGWLGDDGNYYDEATVYTAERDMTFTAQWSAHKYTVEYNANYPTRAKGERSGYMDSSEFICGESSAPSLNAFLLQGWNFIGWNTSPDGSGASAAEAMSAAQKNETVTLYVQWRAQVYNIIYETEDGATFPENPNTFEADTVTQLENPSKSGYLFNGWLIRDARYNVINENAKEIKNIYEDVYLKANWTKISDPKKYYINGRDTEKEIDFYNSEVILPKTQFDDSCCIRVNSDVNIVKFIGVANIAYKMHIIMESRNCDLEMTLENCVIEAPDGCDAIKMMSEHVLTLVIDGVCSIRGGNGITSKLYLEGASVRAAVGAGNGMAGIRCHSLKIKLNNDLTLTGGEGARGRNGAPGTPKGEDGGAGGMGGSALIVADSTTLEGNNKLTLVGGDGGDGGNGGAGVATPSCDSPKGGAGGKGGMGGKAVNGKLSEGSATVVTRNGEDGVKGYAGFIATELI